MAIRLGSRPLTRWLVLGLICGFADISQAHFVFIVPQPGGVSGKVILSEDLQPDAELELLVAGDAKFYARAVDGKIQSLDLQKVASDQAELKFTGDHPRLVYGTANLGVMQRGGGKPFLLIYHPKTILGDAFQSNTSLNREVPVEISPIGKPGAVAFKVMAQGRPVANAEVNLVLPDGERVKVSTDANGQTENLAARGRYAAWTRYFEPGAGEYTGKQFEEKRHYATLVVDVGDKSE